MHIIYSARILTHMYTRFSKTKSAKIMVMLACEHHHWAGLILGVIVLHFYRLRPACYMHAIQDVFGWEQFRHLYCSKGQHHNVVYLHGYSYPDHA